MKGMWWMVGAAALGLGAGVGVAGEADVLAAKQAQVLYDARAQGLRDYVAVVSCSEWAKEPRLRDARLVVRLATWELKAEGLPPDAEGASLERMVRDFGDLARRLEPLTQRVDAGTEGYRVAVTRGEGHVDVVATIQPGEEPGDQPLLVRTRLDERLLPQEIEERYAGDRVRRLTRFAWSPRGTWFVATGLRMEEGAETTDVVVDPDPVGGFLLPTTVTLQRGDRETRFGIAYRSVNDQPVTSVGPFGTPEATVRAFLDAAARKDPGMAGKCFSENGAEEFRVLREGHATPAQVDELAAMFGASRVLGVDLAPGARTAVVRITLRRGTAEAEEQLEMALEDEGWMILDF